MARNPELPMPQKGEATPLDKGVGRIVNLLRSRKARAGSLVLTAAALVPTIAAETSASASAVNNPTMRITAASHPGVDFNKLSQHRDPTPKTTPSALPKPLKATETIVVHKGQTETSIARVSLKKAGVKRTDANVTRIVHTIDGLNEQVQADHINPGDRLTVYIPAVDKEITVLGTTRLPSTSPSEIVSAQRAIYQTTHYAAGKTYEDQAVRQGDKGLVEKINSVIQKAYIQGSAVANSLKANELDLSVPQSPEPQPQPASRHQKQREHGQQPDNKRRDQHTPSISAEEISLARRAGIVIDVTKGGHHTVWDEINHDTIPGITMGTAGTNANVRIAQALTPHKDLNNVQERTHFKRLSQIAGSVVYGIVSITPAQLQELKQHVSPEALKTIKALQLLNHQSKNTPQEDITEANNKAARIFTQFAIAYHDHLAKYGEQFKQIAKQIAKHPEEAAKFKQILFGLLEKALPATASPSSINVHGLSSAQQEALAKTQAITDETAPAKASPSALPTKSKAPTYIIGNHRVLAPAHVYESGNITENSRRAPVLPSGHVYISPADSRSLAAGQKEKKSLMSAARIASTQALEEGAILGGIGGGGGLLVAGAAVGIEAIARRSRRKREQVAERNRSAQEATRQAQEAVRLAEERRLRELLSSEYLANPLVQAQDAGRIMVVETNKQGIEAFVAEQVQQYPAALTDRETLILTMVKRRLLNLQHDPQFIAGKLKDVLTTTLETDADILAIVDDAPDSDPISDAATYITNAETTSKDPYVRLEKTQHAVDTLLNAAKIKVEKRQPQQQASTPRPATAPGGGTSGKKRQRWGSSWRRPRN